MNADTSVGQSEFFILTAFRQSETVPTQNAVALFPQHGTTNQSLESAVISGYTSAFKKPPDFWPCQTK